MTAGQLEKANAEISLGKQGGKEEGRLDEQGKVKMPKLHLQSVEELFLEQQCAPYILLPLGQAH